MYDYGYMRFINSSFKKIEGFCLSKFLWKAIPQYGSTIRKEPFPKFRFRLRKGQICFAIAKIIIIMTHLFLRNVVPPNGPKVLQ